MKISASINELIGGTPLLEPVNYSRRHGLKSRLLLKLEYLNPTGSVKDRAAQAIIEDAERSGRLTPGGTIIEPTSGNTGIGLAALAAAKGYKAILIMPESMSVERRNLLKAYGAEIVLTPAAEGMAGSLRKAEELQAATPGSIIAGQFDNPVNATAHYKTTGPEIWADTEGSVDALVAGIGTGGTITGTGRYLKEQKPGVRVIGIEPAASPLLSTGHAGPHSIQGIGANFIPSVLQQELCDEILTVDNEAPFAAARELAQTEGLLVGISSGAALHAATQVAQRPEFAGKTIVVILPDSADRYYSTPLFG
ncbi:MAG: cysteine synthase A [Akkermansia sp.]|nr:cysteine synthase A [Akkermansia sp.]